MARPVSVSCSLYLVGRAKNVLSIVLDAEIVSCS